MKRARFVAAARREFLAEVEYYDNKEAGLGGRFAAAVEEATVRALAYPQAGTPATNDTPRVFLKDFPFALYTGRTPTASPSLRLLTIRVGRAIGDHVLRTANVSSWQLHRIPACVPVQEWHYGYAFHFELDFVVEVDGDPREPSLPLGSGLCTMVPVGHTSAVGTPQRWQC